MIHGRTPATMSRDAGNHPVSWRVFDARAYLDFGTEREVDLHGNFLDFGGQLSTGIVF